MTTSPPVPCDAHARYRWTRYFPFIDGIRYLLVAIVVIDHAGAVWPVLNGGVAVLVFFVMSVFLVLAGLLQPPVEPTLLCPEETSGGYGSYAARPVVASSRTLSPEFRHPSE